MITILLFVLLAPIFIFILYGKYQYGYWKRKKVPEYNKEPKLPFGHIPSVLSKKSRNMGLEVQDFYTYFRKIGAKHGGFYFIINPVYIPCDLDLIKQVMSIDFEHFHSKGLFFNAKKQPISGHLFNIGGKKWRNLRTKLTPTFTSGKMKMMFNTLLECSKPLEQSVADLASKRKEFDIKKLAAQFTTDVIGSCAFGIDCNSFAGEGKFLYYGRKAFTPTLTRMMARFFQEQFPKAARLLGMTTMPLDVEEFFTNMVTETVRYREENNVVRKDFIQLLIELKNKENESERLSMQDIIAQSFLFFLAGFETSSTTMSYCLLELSLHPEIQDKLRDNITTTLAKHNGEITYEALTEMKYLQQVLDETLRLHPPVPIVNRQCTADYKIPDTDITLEKGTNVFIPVLGVHHDPEIYPNPDSFRPERFSDEEKQERHPYAFLPFGEGPRACIGLRFGYMQAKVGLVILLTKFRFALSQNIKLPLQYMHGLILQAKQDLTLVAEPIN